MIVPFAAGGATDTLARILAERMRRSLRQTIIIEDVSGADGSLGVGRAVRARPDGYTIDLGPVDSILNAAITDALADPAVRSRLADLGMDIFPRGQQTPEALRALVKADAAKWWPIMKEFGIRAE